MAPACTGASQQVASLQEAQIAVARTRPALVRRAGILPGCQVPGTHLGKRLHHGANGVGQLLRLLRLDGESERRFVDVEGHAPCSEQESVALAQPVSHVDPTCGASPPWQPPSAPEAATTRP